jgi:hypothetical protein
MIAFASGLRMPKGDPFRSSRYSSQAKKRPPAIPAWIDPGLVNRRGEEPQSQENALSGSILHREFLRRAEYRILHIFWTELNVFANNRA